MDRLIAQSSIQTLLHTLAYAEDELDRPTLLSLFAPNKNLLLDVSNHLSSLPPSEITPSELWDSIYLHLAGFTATQHMLGNMLIDFEGEGCTKAHVKAQVRAYHCIEREGGRVESVTAHGLWCMDVEFEGGRWMVSKIVIRRDVPLDNPGLYEVAKARVEKGECRAAKKE